MVSTGRARVRGVVAVTRDAKEPWELPSLEETDSIPVGSPSFAADGETHHYVNFNF